MLRRVRDFAQVKGSGEIDLEITKYGLKALNIDQHGLDEMDNRILSVIIDKFSGGPVGLNTISTAVGEESGTIEEVYPEKGKVKVSVSIFGRSTPVNILENNLDAIYLEHCFRN